jgi:hypothetical protein
MRRRFRLFTLCVVLFSGCGGNPAPASGFVNHTQHSDAQLWALWKNAKQTLSRQIDLNPLQRTETGASANILPGDRRAWGVQPKQIEVSPAPDVASAVLYAATGASRADPTGLISCPAPCNVNYAPAYSLYAHHVSRYAASWEFSGNNFAVLVEYEFENHILNALGYDMRRR